MTGPFPSSFRLHSSSSGFTLLEVLIALVILAVALAAATRTTHMATDSTFVIKQRLIAGWVAENRLAELRASGRWPEPGTNSGEATQAGLQFNWQETVSDTPNPTFRRVEVKVFAGKDQNHADATLAGYVANTKAQ